MNVVVSFGRMKEDERGPVWVEDDFGLIGLFTILLISAGAGFLVSWLVL